MLAQFGWRYLFAAWGIAAALAGIALSGSGLPRLLDLTHAGPASHGLTNPWHDGAAYHPRSDAADPFYDETEREDRHSGQH